MAAFRKLTHNNFGSKINDLEVTGIMYNERYFTTYGVSKNDENVAKIESTPKNKIKSL